MTDNIGMTELDEILLNIMPNGWIKQAYVQVFSCESITFKNLLTCLNIWRYLNIFMKFVVEPYY